MDKPTEAQIKEFWEWCGFYWHGNVAEDRWYIPTCKYYGTKLPQIDLNNLFKYAVPKLEELGIAWSVYSWRNKKKTALSMVKLVIPSKHWYSVSPHFIFQASYSNPKDIALALLRAIDKARKSK